jgi:hypothetical protein
MGDLYIGIGMEGNIPWLGAKLGLEFGALHLDIKGDCEGIAFLIWGI